MRSWSEPSPSAPAGHTLEISMLLGRTSDIRQGPLAGFLQSEIARENRGKAEVIWHELSSQESTFNTELINDRQPGCTLHRFRSRCLSEPFSELPELTEQMDLSKKADGWLPHTSHTVKHAEQHLSRRLRIRVWTSLSQVLSVYQGGIVDIGCTQHFC